MNDHQLQLVTCAQAKLLKDLGFDWKCTMRYDDDTMAKTFPSNHNQWPDTASAPTVALAMKWCKCVGLDDQTFDNYEADESAQLDELLNTLKS